MKRIICIEMIPCVHKDYTFNDLYHFYYKLIYFYYEVRQSNTFVRQAEELCPPLISLLTRCDIRGPRATPSLSSLTELSFDISAH